MSGSPRPWSVSRCVLATLTMVGLAVPNPLQGGEGVININQHKVPDSGSPCNEPPFNVINSTAVDVNAYHVDERTARFDCARAFDRRSRPIVISDDAPIPNGDEEVSFEYIGEICSDAAASGGAGRGKEHFEHYQPDLEKKLEAGQSVNVYAHFPGTDPTTICAAPDSSFATDAKGLLYWMRCKWGPSGVDGTNCAGATPAGGGSAIQFTKNGTLGLSFGSDRERRITWNGQPATLIGYGAMGAAVAAADGRLDPEGYFRVLRYHGFNLTRAWILDQWVGQAICDDPATGDAPTPFGTMTTGYDVEPDNDSEFYGKYFNRLRNFAQAAADRGVVVQLSLFDKWGLVGSDQPDDENQCRGGFFDSPYRDGNNVQNYLPDPDCICGSFDPVSECTDNLTHSRDESNAPGGGPILCENTAHPGFLPQDDSSTPDASLWIHEALVRRTVEELGGIGNVMFEVVNEARKDEDWIEAPDSDGIGDWNETWQEQMARVARQHLPIWIGRDAFNETNRALGGEAADAGGQSWTSSATTNARIWSVVDQQASGSMSTGLRVGFAAAPDPATSTTLAGFLPIPASATSSGNLMTVRADLKRVNGELAVGFEDASGSRVYVEIRAAGANQHDVRLFKRVSGVTTQLAQKTVADVDDPSEANVWLRLRDGSPNGQASVRIDGAAFVGMMNVGLGFSMTPVRGYFVGTKASGLYQKSDGEVDNFEITANCDEPVGCAAPVIADGFETCSFDGWTDYTEGTGNTISANSSSPLNGACDLKVTVNASSSNSEHVQFDNLALSDLKVRFGWKMDLSGLSTGGSGSKTVRFLSVDDTSGTATPHLVMFAQRQEGSGNWRLAAWSYDVGSQNWVFAGGLFLAAYQTAGTAEIECTWKADTNSSPSVNNGELTCLKVGTSQSFSITNMNDYGLHFDRMFVGFLDFDNFGGSGSYRIDDAWVAPIP